MRGSCFIEWLIVNRTGWITVGFICTATPCPVSASLSEWRKPIGEGPGTANYARSRKAHIWTLDRLATCCWNTGCQGGAGDGFCTDAIWRAWRRLLCPVRGVADCVRVSASVSQACASVWVSRRRRRKARWASASMVSRRARSGTSGLRGRGSGCWQAGVKTVGRGEG